MLNLVLNLKINKRPGACLHVFDSIDAQSQIAKQNSSGYIFAQLSDLAIPNPAPSCPDLIPRVLEPSTAVGLLQRAPARIPNMVLTHPSKRRDS